MKSKTASYLSATAALATLGIGLACLPVFAAAGDIVGTWLTGDGDGWVDITMQATGISGIIAGTPNDDPQRSKVDNKNPDPALQQRELLGLELFSGFHFDGKERWVDGKIYDPNSGKTYKCVITIVDADTLRVRGFIGIVLLGRTEIWTRKHE